MFITEKEVTLGERTFKVYLKEVPTKIAVGGATERTTIRAFIKQIKNNKR